MPDPLVITHSDIHNFLQCRRKWGWDFINDYRKSETVFGALACGSRVHASLEHYYKGLGDARDEHERLFRIDYAALEADPDCPPWGLDQMHKDIIMGRNAVAAHMDWLSDEGADDLYDIEAVEQVVEAPMLGGKVLLRGKVDVLFRRRDNGFLVINDLKTDGGMLGLREMLERSWQHHVYLIALRESRPTEFVQEAYYTIIKKVMNPKRVKTGMVERHKVPGTSKMATNKKAQLEVILSRMLDTVGVLSTPGSEAHAYPSPSSNCRFCDYRLPCEVADESTQAAGEMLDRLYIKGGRHARYTP